MNIFFARFIYDIFGMRKEYLRETTLQTLKSRRFKFKPIGYREYRRMLVI